MAIGFQQREFFLSRLKKHFTPAQIKIITAAKIESTDYANGRSDRKCQLYSSREPLTAPFDQVSRKTVEQMCSNGLLVCEPGAVIEGVDFSRVTWFPKCQRCEEAVDNDPQLIGGKFYCLECTCRDCGEILSDGEFDTCYECSGESDDDQHI